MDFSLNGPLGPTALFHVVGLWETGLGAALVRSLVEKTAKVQEMTARCVGTPRAQVLLTNERKFVFIVV